MKTGQLDELRTPLILRVSKSEVVRYPRWFYTAINRDEWYFRPMIVALVGMTGSGKSEVSSHLASQGFPAIRFGQVVVDEIANRGWQLNPKNERTIREELRATEGMDVCARRCLPAIRKAFEKSPLVVIDGLYSWSEYRTLRAALGEDLILLLVYTSKATRYQRLKVRLERPLTSQEAEERDIKEIENIEKGGPIAFADFALLNDGTKAELLAGVDDLLERWRFRSPHGEERV
jgi:dephospho-CoA kinase